MAKRRRSRSRRRRRKRTKRKGRRGKSRRRKGGSVVGALKTALLPFLLYKGQKHMQRKVGRKRRRTKKR